MKTLTLLLSLVALAPVLVVAQPHEPAVRPLPMPAYPNPPGGEFEVTIDQLNAVRASLEADWNAVTNENRTAYLAATMALEQATRALDTLVRADPIDREAAWAAYDKAFTQLSNQLRIARQSLF